MALPADQTHGPVQGELRSPGRTDVLAPCFPLLLPDGRPLAFRELASRRPVLLWFSPRSLAVLQRWAHRLRKRGVLVIACGPHSVVDAHRIGQRLGFPFAFLADPGGLAARAFRVETLPKAAFLVDRSGRIRWRWFGERSAEEALEQAERAILALTRRRISPMVLVGVALVLAALAILTGRLF